MDPRQRFVGFPILLLFLVTAGCAEFGGPTSGEPQGGESQPASRPLDSKQADRVGRIMVPLVGAMDHPRPLNQVRVAIIDDPHVNAAGAGDSSSPALL
jgi:hypothetical protein